MKISPTLLRRYIGGLPEDDQDLVDLMEDCGLEVKRVDDADGTTVFTLELLANRGDHHCYLGLARELSGRTGGPLCAPEHAALEVGETPFPLRLETDKCLRYSATLMERVEDGGTLNEETLAPLSAAGIHSLTAPVDATNLSNMELGQPTHAFDADTLDGAIVIRESVAGETCHPLFHEDRVELPEGTLVIADESKILAIAGVIGCEESKTTPETQRLLLESATFDPVAVRKGSRSLQIFTDSSARFERGSDPAAPLIGAGRVVKLLEEQAGWKRVGTTGHVGDWEDPKRTIPLDVDRLNAFLHTELSEDKVAERLGRYGFACAQQPDHVDVRVPPHRLWDVENHFDLYEEIAKSVGYNHTPTELPDVDMGAQPSREEVRRGIADQVMVSQGFFEVITDGFYGREAFERLGAPEDHPLNEHLNTLNALDRGYSLLKNNALVQALDVVLNNLNMRHDEVKAYEWTRTFHPLETAEGSKAGARTESVCTERQLLWAIASGHVRPPTWAGDERAADAYFLKGLVEELAVGLDLPLQLGPADAAHPLSFALHPGRQATVQLRGETVGILGEVHPEVLETYKIKRARPAYVELDTTALLAKSERPSYVEPPAYHPVERSVAFTLPGKVEAGTVAGILRAEGPDTLEAVQITDRYDHEEDGQPVRTITYALHYANPDFDITADEVNAATEALIETVTGELPTVKLRA